MSTHAVSYFLHDDGSGHLLLLLPLILLLLSPQNLRRAVNLNADRTQVWPRREREA